ncbi:MAG: MarR family winged helix-turn-helix transcriptional regulator [Acidimicrobiales bacterium]
MDPRDAPAREFQPEVASPLSIPLEEGLGFRIGRLARALRQQWSRQLQALSLSPPQAAVLRGVHADPGCSLRGLARLLHADPMNVKRCVDDLERRGLVHSGHLDTDRRPRTLVLTSEGVALAHDVTDLVAAQQARLRASLAGPHLQAFTVGLERLESQFLGATPPADGAVDSPSRATATNQEDS